MSYRLCLVLLLFYVTKSIGQEKITLNFTDDGYRGIWYSDQPSGDEYVYKYSGGLGTYPANHSPFAVYVKQADKTFFCYGGADKAQTTLLHMVAYFDHRTKRVSRPTVVLDKATDNAHDNPVINVDSEGYIWLFSTANGTNRPAYIHRSIQPYDISAFEQINPTKRMGGKEVPMDNFSYLQSWYSAEKGFLNLFTHYEYDVIPAQPRKPRRTIGYMYSTNGVDYEEWLDLARIEEGHYQTSAIGPAGVIGTVFNYHPYKKEDNGLNYRTNLYYLQSKDFGRTWQTIEGLSVDLPLTKASNPACIKTYEDQGLNVYINDLTFDVEGNPIVLFLTSKGYRSGPQNGHRYWYTAYYKKGNWEVRPVTHSDNNYDMGSLYVTENGGWRIIAPTQVGPQPYNTGGEMVLWSSKDQGQVWEHKQLTYHSVYNHSYARRPVNVHPDFYAFWADGHGRQKSVSRLYFADAEGRVFMLPTQMSEAEEYPIRVHTNNAVTCK